MGHSDLDPPYMKDGPRMQEKTSDQTAAEAARHMPQRTTAMLASDALPQISSSNVMCRASAGFNICNLHTINARNLGKSGLS